MHRVLTPPCNLIGFLPLKSATGFLYCTLEIYRTLFWEQNWAEQTEQFDSFLAHLTDAHYYYALWFESRDLFSLGSVSVQLTDIHHYFANIEKFSNVLYGHPLSSFDPPFWGCDPLDELLSLWRLWRCFGWKLVFCPSPNPPFGVRNPHISTPLPLGSTDIYMVYV